MEQEYIVFGDEHYNPLGIVRSLGENGISSIVIVVKSKATVLSSSKYIKKLYKVDDVLDGYLLLLSLCKSAKTKPFVYTTDDIKTSFLDQKYDELKDVCYFFNAGANGRITEFMDKDNINKLAKKYGLNVLPTYRVKKGEIPSDIEYPIITKAIASTIGGWKNDVFICHNDDELRNAYKTIQSKTVLLQRYIEKKNELCLDGLVNNKGNELFVSIASNYNYILPSQYSSYMTIFNFDDADIQASLNGMMKEIGFEGIFSAEFLVDQDDKLWFLEINFRNSTWSYASTCLGMNLPVLWSQSMLLGHIPENSIRIIPKGYTAMVEITDFKTRVLGRKIGLLKWLKEFKNTDCLFYYNKYDKKPFWTTLASKL